MLVDCPNCKSTVVTPELKIGDGFICPKCKQEAKYFHGDRGFNSGKTIGENIGTSNSAQSYKTCPYCAEKDLQVDAIVCKHCKKDLPSIGREKIDPAKPAEVSGGLVVVCMLFVLWFSGIFTPNSSNEGIPNSNGSSVQNSEWDSSVHQVKNWLKKELKDPESLEFIDWSPVEKTDYGYMVRTRYRAKNSFGGYVIENKLFRLTENGVVIGSSDFK